MASRRVSTRIGETMHRQFLNERKSGEDKGVFDPMKKRKLVTFKTASKTITVKLANKLVKLKEERKFTSKLLVIMRTRPDIDIAELFRVHEFSVVPRALFDHYGIPLRCSDKSGFLHGIEEVLKLKGSSDTALTIPAEHPIAIIDAMGLVNQLKITSAKDSRMCTSSPVKRARRGTVVHQTFIPARQPARRSRTST